MDPQVQTIFCDDIRREVAGKLSFIGVYSGNLLAQTFPITLPKLCLLVRIISPVDQPIRTLQLRVLRDEEKLQEISLDEADLKAVSDTEEAVDGDSDKILVAQFLLEFSPMKFDGPCILRVRVDSGHGELKGVGLRVEHAHSDSSMI